MSKVETETLTPKKVSESKAELVDLVLPPDTNHHGTIFGGKVMAYADKIAVISAMRHCRKPVVTVRSDSFEFHAPITAGDAICIEASVVCAHRTSMEVFVKVHSEDLLTGETKMTSQAHLTMIAVDENNRPTPVPQVIPETEEEKQHYQFAMERYEARKRALKASK
ncbi:acyl-CoA thioesterase [Bacillus testis]|uniref:acyl-CoA thioesterase n=1 Tax=Bacillus testis TaxID=1622072 RepID=UPI00067E96F2|nr:acyl-CoA thioesterase [Bacillus testis]